MSARNHWFLTSALALALVFCFFSFGKRITSLEAQLGLNSSSSHETTEVSTALSTVSPGEGSPRALAQRVRSLELELRHLKDRAGSRPRRQPGSRPPASAAKAHHAAATRTVVDSEDVLEVLDSDDPEVRGRLGEMLRDEMQMQREERREERMTKRKERAERMVRELAEEFGFSEVQVGQLNELLETERDEISALFREARKEHTYGEARDKARELREETDSEVGEVLDEEQQEAWNKRREEELARYYGRRH